MANKYDDQFRDELSDEGKELWDKMMGVPPRPKSTKPEKDRVLKTVRQEDTIIKKVDTQETIRLRLELKKLQQNSRIVVAECLELQKKYIKEECYYKANETRVAALCHSNFIERIQKVLDGGSAFPDDEETRYILVVQ